VLNPTHDGGYCLIGKGNEQPLDASIFSAIDWSTDQVMTQTRQGLQRQRIQWIELPAIADIDDMDAAERYLTEKAE
jgi:uncharacterized protein